MKQITQYITEKANFLVKKHLPKVNNVVFGDFMQWFCEQRSHTKLNGKSIFEIESKTFDKILEEAGRKPQYYGLGKIFNSKSAYRNWIIKNKDTFVEEFTEEELDSKTTGNMKYRYTMRISGIQQIFRTPEKYIINRDNETNK